MGSSGTLPGVTFRPRKPRTNPNPGGSDAEGEPARPARVPTPEEARDNLLAYAFRALGARALTAAELRAKLERRSDDEALVQEVLERVQELGYQDDAQVAQAEGARRGIGGFRVRQTLKRRGVTAPLIDETMQARDPDDEQASATELLSRRWPSLSRKRDPRSSAYGFLARRGFPGAVIWNAIREVSAEQIDDEDAVEPEFVDDEE
ncbi:recombination regulator RecX [Deinococcus oregonensis]|uniref:Regulatory protein RecX n=1 Tax=Deinococcus oregonensis TaxID=1805970 RepID=A0ABV6B1I2_9DEIO